jgi:hypothetical protein
MNRENGYRVVGSRAKQAEVRCEYID